jgi:catechol 2,3-dioxygenase-like lactoylglutathione lyase family enzyme
MPPIRRPKPLQRTGQASRYHGAQVWRYARLVASGMKVVKTIDLTRAGIPWPFRLLMWFINRFGRNAEGPYLDRSKRLVEQPALAGNPPLERIVPERYIEPRAGFVPAAQQPYVMRYACSLLMFVAVAIAGCHAPHRVEKSMDNDGYQLSLLKIPVSNITRSAAFYRDALGFEQQFAAEEYGWAQFQSGPLPLALYKPGMGGGDGKIGGSTGFHLSLPPVRFDALAGELQKRGSLVGDRVHRGDDGTTFIEVRDPDGNTLKIMRTMVE